MFREVYCSDRCIAVKCFKYFLRSLGDVEEKEWKERLGDPVAAKSSEIQERTSKCADELAQEEVLVVGEVREKERTTKWADVRGNEEMEG